MTFAPGVNFMLTALNQKANYFPLANLLVILLLSYQSIVCAKHIYPTTYLTNNTSDYDNHKDRPKTYKNESLPVAPKSTYDPIEKTILRKISPAEFQDMFQSTSNDTELIKHLELFADQDFLANVRTFYCYDSVILNLKTKIDYDKTFRNKTKNIPGFTYKHFLWWEKSGFHDFINHESKRIKSKRAHETYKRRQQEKTARKQKKEHEFRQKYCLHTDNTQELDALSKSYKERALAAFQAKNLDVSTRLLERAKAIEKTRQNPNLCFEYSSHVSHLKDSAHDKYADAFNKTFGTHLDCQLHKELCETRNAVIQLQQDRPRNFHTTIIAPVVHHLAAQAKTEQNPAAAFELSDICHTITHVIVKGIQTLRKYSRAAISGTVTGMNKVLSLEHWQDMVTAPLQLGLLFLQTAGHEMALQDACLAAPLSKNNTDFANTLTKEYCLHSQAQINFIQQQLQQTCHKLSVVPWSRLAEFAAELGVTMILDTVMLHTVFGVFTKIGRMAIKLMNTALETGTLFTTEHAVNVAGFGKLIIEDGYEATIQATKAIKNDLDFFKTSANKPIAHKIKNHLSKATKPTMQNLEKILPQVKTFEQARNKALKLVGNMGPNSKAYYGKLKSSKGLGKIIGRTSFNGKIRWYLDYDPVKGIHINVHDFRVGKGLSSKRYAIPFEGTEKTFKILLNHLNC